MKITFVVPTLNLSGGLRVIAIYAGILSELGHNVTVVTPRSKKITYKQRVKEILRWKGYKFKSSFDETYFRDVNFDVLVTDSCEIIKSTDVPDADVIIATWWETAEWVAQFPESKGNQFYFIQHYETHNETLSKTRVEQTYSLPLHQITIAKWLVNILVKKYHSSEVFFVPNSVEHKDFYAEPRNKRTIPTIGFLFQKLSRKALLQP